MAATDSRKSCIWYIVATRRDIYNTLAIFIKVYRHDKPDLIRCPQNNSLTLIAPPLPHKHITQKYSDCAKS